VEREWFSLQSDSAEGTVQIAAEMDFFNVLNMRGTPMPDANTGIISLQTSDNTPRVLQWTARLTW
jgi:hypothetical protein